jgi:uncharacterized membrane protein YhaH (DUF805 family)
MEFGKAITTCLRKTFTYSGRASRSEYWWFMGFHSTLLVFTLLIVYGNFPFLADWERPPAFDIFCNVIFYFYLLLWLPSFSAAIRRGHDFENSGLITYLLGIPLLFIAFFSIYDYIWTYIGFSFEFMMTGMLITYPTTLVLITINSLVLTKRSDPNTNKYGPNPLEVTS